MARRTLCGEIPILARRRVGQYNASGRYEMVKGEPFTIFATVNPIPGEVLASLEEGERLGKQFRVLSTDETLLPPDEETGYAGDEVYYEGSWYSVRDRQPYPTVIPHMEYRVRRLTPRRTDPLA